MTEFHLEHEVLKALDVTYPCAACRGIRFKSCKTCGRPVNSFHDFRGYQCPAQVYETTREWREVNGDPAQNVPDRKLQP